MLTEDVSIFAELLIQQHGSAAELVALRKAESFNTSGDLENCQAWLKVRKEVRDQWSHLAPGTA